MKFYIFFQFILLLICVTVFAEEDELVFVNILYRHGDRTPIFQYATDPFNNESLWPTEFGQLTNTGKEQHYELGTWFRNRYSNHLPEKYSFHDIYIESTNIDRTIMSAESNLAGLYPPNGTDIWNKNLKWQPIPIHLYDDSACSSYEEKFQELMNTEEFKNYTKQASPIYEYVTNHSGTVVDNFQTLNYFYDTLFIETLYGFQLPDWTSQVFPKELIPWAEFSFKIPCYTDELARLKIGAFLYEVFHRFVVKSKGELDPDRKVWVYSAHDSDVANVLMALHAFDEHIPMYTAAVIFELRRSKEIGYYITAFYKNGPEIKTISMRNCEIKCPLEKAVKLLKPVFMTNEEWNQECDNKRM